jgi:hypothetical protein
MAGAGFTILVWLAGQGEPDSGSSFVSELRDEAGGANIPANTGRDFAEPGFATTYCHVIRSPPIRPSPAHRRDHAHDAMHLGHAFTYTPFDVLVPAPRARSSMQNVTDIDDDVLRRARYTSRAGEAGREVPRGGAEQPGARRQPACDQHCTEMCAITQSPADKAGPRAWARALRSRGAVARKLFLLPYDEKLRIANQNGNRPTTPAQAHAPDCAWQGWQEGEPWCESPGRGRLAGHRGTAMGISTW